MPEGPLTAGESGHERIIKTKVCLVGDEEVPKTALIRRSVSGAFDEAYLRTLGAVVSKKTVDMGEIEGRSVRVDLSIYDIMGKRTFLPLFREAFFPGARGILAVFDVTRRESLRDLPGWIDEVRRTEGPIPVVVVGAGIEHREKAAVTEEDVRQVAETFDAPYVFASAETGENVEEMFRLISGEILRARRPSTVARGSEDRPAPDTAEFEKLYRETFGGEADE